MIRFSLEVFPAKTLKGETELLNLIDDFASFKPDFISVTCGANGTEQGDLTLNTTKKIFYHDITPTVPHITAIGHSKQSMKKLLDYYHQMGISRVLLLRGDKPKNKIKKLPSDFSSALELIEFCKKSYPFQIYTAAYPEFHPEAFSANAELDYLKAKVDAGATKIITQFFMDPEVFLRFRDQVAARAIKAELVPGILPILNFAKVKEFSKKCGTSVPKFMDKMFAGIDSKSIDHKLLTMNILSHQITRLIDASNYNFHLYTLNHSTITRHLCIWMKSAF